MRICWDVTGPPGGGVGAALMGNQDIQQDSSQII
jgi:hypothetical protein